MSRYTIRRSQRAINAAEKIRQSNKIESDLGVREQPLWGSREGGDQYTGGGGGGDGEK